MPRGLSEYPNLQLCCFSNFTKKRQRWEPKTTIRGVTRGTASHVEKGVTPDGGSNRPVGSVLRKLDAVVGEPFGAFKETKRGELGGRGLKKIGGRQESRRTGGDIG